MTDDTITLDAGVAKDIAQFLLGNVDQGSHQVHAWAHLLDNQPELFSVLDVRLWLTQWLERQPLSPGLLVETDCNYESLKTAWKRKQRDHDLALLRGTS